jgi:hypothetical protein
VTFWQVTEKIIEKQHTFSHGSTSEKAFQEQAEVSGHSRLILQGV